MANQLKVPANSTLTHHLKPLIDCGLLAVRREGTFRYYSLQGEVLAQYDFSKGVYIDEQHR